MRIEEPKYRDKMILGMPYARCEQCKYTVPQVEARYYEKRWFLGLFHHYYRVCIRCLRKAGIEDKKILPGPIFDAWIETADGRGIGAKTT